MSTDSKLDDIDNLSHEELVALEDSLIEGEETGGEDAAEQNQTVVDKSESDSDDSAGTEGEQPAGGEDAAEPEVSIQDGEPATGNSEEDDPVKHISPPSKWAAERQRRRELKAELDAAREKAAMAEQMEAELAELKDKLNWIEQTVERKGIDLPDGPMEAFSDENINEIRDEYGDELADMMAAAAMIIKRQGGDNPGKAMPDPEPEPAPGEKETTSAAQPNDEMVNRAISEAIESNDDLSYWREKSPALWKLAVEKDDQLLKDPEYQKLSFEERFEKVVTEVKQDIKGGTGKAQPDQAEMPDSLTGAQGAAPAVNDNNNNALNKILSTDDPDKQLELYNRLSESERDEVDKALNI